MVEAIAVLDAASAALLAALLLVSVHNLVAAPRLEAAGEPRSFPRVSILVPARDEAANLRRTLPRLLALDYPDLEILVLDDESTDATSDVVLQHARRAAGRLRLVRGGAPPPGWVGKNRACHRLAREAAGDVLMFCDADVRPAPDAVRRTVALLQRTGADVVTALPRQAFSGWAEAAVVPLVVQLPVLALLPLRWVPSLRSPALSMANGQWLAFTADAYRRCGGHAAVRDRVVEDVALGRRVKACGDRLVVALAARSLSVRMYAGLHAVRHGFRKNVYRLAGGRPVPFALVLAGFALAAVYPCLALVPGSATSPLPLALLLAVRATGAVFFRHRAAALVLHPVGAVLALAIGIESAAAHLGGRVVWKGRTVPAGDSAAFR